MTEPLQQIASAGLTEQITLDSLSEIQLALKTQIVFCDLIKGKGIPVRKVRVFQPRITIEKAPEWTDRAFQGEAKGYEVLALEGWSVPERVYYVVRKEMQ